MTAEDVQDYCRGKIAWYKIPKYIAFVNSIICQRKVMKYKLRRWRRAMAGRMRPGGTATYLMLVGVGGEHALP